MLPNCKEDLGKQLNILLALVLYFHTFICHVSLKGSYGMFFVIGDINIILGQLKNLVWKFLLFENDGCAEHY